MYEEDLALNNQRWLICHKTKPNRQKMTKYRKLLEAESFDTYQTKLPATKE